MIESWQDKSPRLATLQVLAERLPLMLTREDLQSLRGLLGDVLALVCRFDKAKVCAVPVKAHRTDLAGSRAPSGPRGRDNGADVARELQNPGLDG
jgi:hypothetical protein